MGYSKVLVIACDHTDELRPTDDPEHNRRVLQRIYDVALSHPVDGRERTGPANMHVVSAHHADEVRVLITEHYTAYPVASSIEAQEVFVAVEARRFLRGRGRSDTSFRHASASRGVQDARPGDILFYLGREGNPSQICLTVCVVSALGVRSWFEMLPKEQAKQIAAPSPKFQERRPHKAMFDLRAKAKVV